MLKVWRSPCSGDSWDSWLMMWLFWTFSRFRKTVHVPFFGSLFCRSPGLLINIPVFSKSPCSLSMLIPKQMAHACSTMCFIGHKKCKVKVVSSCRASYGNNSSLRKDQIHPNTTWCFFFWNSNDVLLWDFWSPHQGSSRNNIIEHITTHFFETNTQPQPSVS